LLHECVLLDTGAITANAPPPVTFRQAAVSHLHATNSSSSVTFCWT